jgi:uncharacterized protein YbbC (DUF1343 family)/CubicO group peptidase (beta-lactamase class C family)
MTIFTKRILALFLLLAISTQSFADNLPGASPASVGMSAERLAQIDAAVREAIGREELPGAVVLAARRGRIAFRRAYGSRAILPQREPMTEDTVFDAASLTKVVATATSIMILVERGQIRLTDSISRFIPEIRSEEKERITVEHLLTHRSGYAPDFDLREQWTGNQEALRHLYEEPVRTTPGARFVYSDIGFIALGEIVRRVSGQRLDEFARRHIFEPLGMRDTDFRLIDPTFTASRVAMDTRRARIAPTETRRATAGYLGGRPETVTVAGDEMLRGIVHDPTAQRMEGVAGHAGLFTTADDLAIYCQMILNGGEYGGRRILSPLTVATMTRPRAVSESGAGRGLGWDILSGFSANRGDLFPPGSFGHTGFTGTSIWIDPSSESFVVFLSNRVHPNGRGDVTRLRGRVSSIVAASITDATALERMRAQAAFFASEIELSRARFVAENSNVAGRNTTSAVNAEVLTGIDVLERDRFAPLQNLRIGLVTNHTGRNRAGRQTIDVLREAEGVRLVALFSPEHGIRGERDERVSDSRDERTGLPIYSLYGETRRPRAEHLQNLDALVFDIQDIGTRFYTYISTLGYVMEEAARAGKPVFVLDRPNPINGLEVEGPIADEDKLSFTAYHRIPVRHGMTVGELAKLFNEERRIGCDLRVIRIDNWQRSMWFDQTNLTWINPSPNMRSLTEATLYPGVGLLETTNLSVGRGTDTPFEIVGAPYIDGRRLAAHLNARRIAGVRFVPVRFRPRASVFQNEDCGGVNLIITDRAQFRPVRTGMEIAVALRTLYANEWQVENYARLLANASTLELVRRASAPEEIVRSWSLDDFMRARARALLY